MGIAKDIGPAWIIIEESFVNKTKKLISLINSQKDEEDVMDYISQLYVDRHGSIRERISFKDGFIEPFRAIKYDCFAGCGDEPTYKGFYCIKLNLKDNMLTYTVRWAKKEIIDTVIIQEIPGIEMEDKK